jgi:polysaccharide export outer membrane protein
MRYGSKILIIFTFGAWLNAEPAAKKASKIVETPASASRTLEAPSAPDPDTGGQLKAAAPDVLSTDYRIGAGDVLEVSVWKEPDASVQSATVRPDGKVSVPFVKEILVAGLTPSALEAILSERLAGYFRRPQITVLVKEVNSQKVYVIGEVKKEGAIRLQAPMTVLQALAEAGGLTDYAKKAKIQVFRTEGEKQKIYSFDYSAIVRGQHVEQNFWVVSGDTIVVPR